MASIKTPRKTADSGIDQRATIDETVPDSDVVRPAGWVCRLTDVTGNVQPLLPDRANLVARTGLDAAGRAVTERNRKGPTSMHSMDNLSKLPEMGHLCPETTAAFFAYDEAALSDGAIPKKYKELMAITVALTMQCPYCLELHRQAALQAGATDQELVEAVHVAAVLRASAAVAHGTQLLGG